ncbi:MAG TPA: helix-turn-helix transcriptional regulator [Streptosporangiaceae bacterium]
MSSEVRVGERLRFYRQAKGKTQAVVAGLAGVTEDYLSQIERGLKTPTIALLHRFSKILGVRLSELLGESATEHDEAVLPVGKAVQRALMSYDWLPAALDSPDLSGLRARVDAAWGIWQGSQRRYSEASPVIPDLMADVQAAQRALAGSSEGELRREAARIAADLYFLLRTFAKRIGRTDLSLLAADRAVLAADAADDPVRMAAAKWNLGHILLAQGEPDGAEEVVVKAIEALHREMPQGDQTAVAIEGALWLVSAVAAVRNGDPWKARDQLRDKAWPAARISGEANVMWTVFGPVNVGLHAVSVEMETGQASEALRLADELDPSGLPSLERRTTFALEVARCYEQRRDDPGVFLHLVNAEASGPEDLRYNTLARDLVQGLLKRARPTYAPQVRALAERIDLLA